jgi:two-component system NtrC family sensor kinase
MNGWRVLVIDDEEDIREVLNLTLSDAGYDIRTAPDGPTGLTLCRDFSPHLVITDIRMPGMDGLQVLEQVKAGCPEIEVIVATAFGEMELAIRALQLDASDFITKPISDEALYLALKRAKQRFTSRKQLKDYTALLEKEKAETSQQLAETIAFQRNLIESAIDGILGCDETRRVVIYNPSMQQIAGYSKAEVLGTMTLEQFLAPGEGRRFADELAAEGWGGRGRLVLFETNLRSKSGRDVPVQASATTLHDGQRATGVVCFFRDLQEIRKLEREMADQARILHQDKMMALGRLAASVVHEINNPLSGILNYLRLMMRIIQQGPLSNDRREKFDRYLQLVESETRRCSQIVSSLLDFSRRSPPSFGQVNIDEMIRRCILLSQHKLELSSIRLETNIRPDLPPVHGDFNQLQQCIINLIFNAIDAMPDGGMLRLAGDYDSATKTVVVTVQDSGPGIPAENLPNIFEPFFTTKHEGHGLGLGLSTVFGIIERHGGRVEVQSQPGEGAVFLLKLPVSL